MSFVPAHMRDKVTVYQRTRGADTWAQVGQPVWARVTRLNASGQRRESTLPEPDVTHMVRLPLEAASSVRAGCRLRRAADGLELVVRTVRVHDTTLAAHAVATCAEVDGTVLA